MLVLKPTIRFWIMKNLVRFIIISLLFLVVVTLTVEWRLKGILGFLALYLLCLSAWHYIVLNSVSFIIDVEQIIIKRGVLNRTTHYMEMYRIYDYQKTQNLMEAAFGLMRITILSRDASHHKCMFFGINNDENVVPLIRERVETEKQRKNIVEFNNPYGMNLN
jgi:uncharacterized membrane protein YdbT with pleckstrin-like domain